MNEERNDKIKEAAKQHSDKVTDVLSFIKEALWTDKHIEELFNDFYLIPKK